MPCQGLFSWQWGTLSDCFKQREECPWSGVCLRKLILAAVWRMRVGRGSVVERQQQWWTGLERSGGGGGSRWIGKID